MLSPHLKRDRFGLVRNHRAALEFLYKQPDGRAESIRIGKAVCPHAEWPGSRVSSTLSALCRKKLVECVSYGYYGLTEDGKRLVEEMGDDEEAVLEI